MGFEDHFTLQAFYGHSCQYLGLQSLFGLVRHYCSDQKNVESSVTRLDDFLDFG